MPDSRSVQSLSLSCSWSWRWWRRWLTALGVLIFFAAAAGPTQAAPDPFGGSSARQRKAKKKRRPSSPARSVDSQPEDEEEEEEAAPPPPTRRRPAAVEEDSHVDEDDDGEEEEEEEEDRPPPRRRRGRVAHEDEDEGDEDSPITSLASIAPRSASLLVGISTMARKFDSGPTLQRESALGRFGPAIALESFPLIGALRGWPRRIGISGSYALELGRAGVTTMDGATVSYPVHQSRWNIDVRYAFTPGQSVAIVPIIGLGHSYYDLRRSMPIPYGMCTRVGPTSPCLADSPLTYLRLGVLTRFAINAEIAISLELAFEPVTSVGKAPGEIGQEAQAVQGLGYLGDLGLIWAQTSWLDLRVNLPVNWFGLRLTGTPMYPTVKEMYYGLVIGLAAHTN